MLKPKARRDYASGPGGPPGATAAAALTDVVAAIKGVLTAADLPAARTALGLGNVSNLAPADLGISTATAASIASLAALVSANQTALSTILAGANPAIDTFIEAYNRFVSDESAAAAMLASISALQTAVTTLTGRQVATPAGGGLQGGGDHSADRSLSIAANGVTNAMLATVPTLTLKANLLGTTAAVTDVGLSALLDASFSNTRGSVLYRGAGGWAALGPAGSAGQFLGSGGAGADPSWGTPSGAGNVSTSGSPAAGQFALFASGTSIKGVAAPSFRNRLINGNFAINQRGAASASTAYSAGAYVMDRWKAGSGGCTLSFAAAANGDVTVTITAGTLVQVIEGGLYLPEGGAYLLSWTGTATARVYQGTATGSYVASPIAATGLTAGTNATVEVSTGTITLAQFEPGGTATAFERRDDEKRRCERYYEASQCYIYFNSYTGGANISQQVRMTEKRINPSVSISGIASSSANAPNTTVLNTKEIMFSISSTAQALAYYQFYYYASAEL